MKHREWGIDLMKIVAMLLIVMDHIVYWGGWGLGSNSPGIKGAVLETFNAYSLCAVNCFVLASGWILAKLEFKWNRIFKLWLQVWGYSLAFVLLSRFILNVPELTNRELVFSLLPLCMNRYWFFTQYVGLFLMMPVLNVAIRHLDKKTLSRILVAGFLLFSVHAFAFKNDMFHVYRGYCVFWFMYLYLFAGTMSVHGFLSKMPTRFAICGVLFGGVGTYGSLRLIQWLSPKFGMTSNCELFNAYNSPILFIFSVSMLVVCSRIRVNPVAIQKLIGIIGPSIFAVYIIHCNFCFRRILHWNNLWKSILDNHSTTACLGIVVFWSIVIFCGCILIDYARRMFMRVLTVQHS